MREELGLRPAAPLCPWKLAQYLHIPVFALSAYAGLHPQEVRYLMTGEGQKDFSAVTCMIGRKRLIIHNDAHDPKRQASNLAHEIAHALLDHPSHVAPTAQGARSFDKACEDEANWMGPALLISDEAALYIAANMSVDEASDYYKASKEVIQMRLNVTAAYKRVA